MSKNLLSISDLSKKEILDLIEFAKNFKQDDGSFRKENLFPDKTIANVFCEPSTRTKSSFEIAAKNLGCSVVGFDISNSPFSTDEFEISKPITEQPRFLAAISKEDLVLVLGSQKTFAIVLSGNKFSFRKKPSSCLKFFANSMISKISFLD